MSGIVLAALLSAAPLSAIAADAVEGLSVGYYQEDPLTNSEDPMPGSIHLSLPAGDSSLSGSMFFTYVGCQTENLGTSAGTKAGPSLKGEWGGSVDGRRPA